MEKLKENHLYLKVLKFGEANPGGFTYQQIIENIELKTWERNVVKRYLYNATQNHKQSNKVLHETIFIINDIDTERSFWSGVPLDIDEGNTEEEKIDFAIKKYSYILKYDAYFNYIDYLELQKAIKNADEANKHANEAKLFAIASIFIAIITGVFQINKDSLIVKWISSFL